VVLGWSGQSPRARQARLRAIGGRPGPPDCAVRSRKGSRTRAANPGPVRRSWMPVMGLVQLQRALEGAIPSFDPIRPAERRRVLGDNETGSRRQCLDDPGVRERGWKSPLRAARKGRTNARDDGCWGRRNPTGHWGESWMCRDRTGQPVRLAG